MKLTTLFRASLIASFLIGILSVASMFLTVPLLPPELQSYLENEDAILSLTENLSPAVLKSMLVAAIGIVLAILIGTVTITVGLYFWRRWARSLYLITTILFLLSSIFLGPVVLSGPTEFLYGIGYMLTGFILALAYFSPVAEKFRKVAVETSPPPVSL